MSHFIDEYADRVNDMLHKALGGTRFYKQEVIEVPGLLAGLLITYDGVLDDTREIHDHLSWENFLQRMAKVKGDWIFFRRDLMEDLGKTPQKVICGWEGRTIYFIRGGRHPEQWTPSQAQKDAETLLISSSHLWGDIISSEAENLREIIPVGQANFREYEHMVRVIFNFLFHSRGELAEGFAQSRTEPENEGAEIRDIVFANTADVGFWKDLKEKYAASEVVVDAKNTDELRREDLRQLYCYLKPALGFWGFVVCRSPQAETIHAFNRTLHKNFCQERGVLILCDDDLRRMIAIARKRSSPSLYLRDRMSEFVRSI